MKTLWNDCSGAVVSSELVMVSALMVVGLVSSLSALRNAVVGEINDTAAAISAFDQSYSIDETRNGETFTAGSRYIDQKDELAPAPYVATCTEVVSSALRR